ncbi:DHA2 family efflux MFS transporter permease subunit [Janibacter melonis]|uniref:DHA2 family efflux MFS transporter permease subunit n=1 Tax=Janibacter melonis TaxID=262209 RepID=UPI00178334A0|nr:DHA2 family efflux MFS transporter permease subunit [Janibacter melonis]MBD5829763.1 MFS transporter [Janibacter melonis]MCB5992977.1 DHA2 family efflux MFS transporter permease subunit [Janibacter melonis]MCM3554024.1 DHA2 family efflux MFS transporter permease subunit [Janibacter melonis]
MSSTAPAGTQAYPEKIDAAVLKVAGVVVLGAIMSILDITVVNVALPHFQTDLATGPDPLQYSTVAWTVTGYTLALATVIPLTGWAADRFGTKRLYLTAVALFALGSTLCAFAPSIEALIGFRVLQGLGGGMLMPLGMTIMTRAAGPQRMGRLMAILGVPMLLGPIGGPILGGWLIDNAHWLGRPSWTWIFLINLPIGAAALVYAWVVLPKDSAVPSESLDVVGLLLMSPGLALFLYGVSSIPDTGTILATKVLAPALVGIVLMAAFAWWSFKPEHPLLDLSLFTNRNFTVAALTMFLFAAAFFGGLLLVPTYFQQVRGEDTFTAGLLLAPQGIGALITMPIAGALVDKMPVGRIVPFGIALITGGMFALTQIDAETSYWGYIIPVLFVMGLGMGGTMMPLMTSALKTLTAHQVARGSTLLNITQQVASSFGVAIISVLLTNSIESRPLVDQAQKYGDAAKGATDPNQVQQLLERFPEVARVIGQVADPARAQEVLMAAVRSDLAGAFASTYWVSGGLCALTLVVALFLPRKREESHLLDGDEDAEPVHVAMH